MIQYRSTVGQDFQVLKHDPTSETLMVTGMVKDVDIELDNVKAGGFKALSIITHRQIPLSKEEKRAARYFRRIYNKGQENAVYARVIAQHQIPNET